MKLSVKQLKFLASMFCAPNPNGLFCFFKDQQRTAEILDRKGFIQIHPRQSGSIGRMVSQNGTVLLCALKHSWQLEEARRAVLNWLNDRPQNHIPQLHEMA